VPCSTGALVSIDDVIAYLEQIKGLVAGRQFDLALAVTEKLEARLDTPEDGDEPVSTVVRDLLRTSRQMTEACVKLQKLTVH
jgi:hypothetical protein